LCFGDGSRRAIGIWRWLGRRGEEEGKVGTFVAEFRGV
jgi:hypothetical protein